MKKVLLTLILTLALLFTLIAVVSAAQPPEVAVIDANGNEYYEQDLHFYLYTHKSESQQKHQYVNNCFFLPSTISPNSPLTVKRENGTIETITLTNKTTDGNGNECYKKGIGGTTYTFYFASNLPSIYLTTSITDAELYGDKIKDENVKATITDKSGTVYYTDTEYTNCELKVRGNATTNYPKLPFQLKLDKKTSILGMEEAKTWILLANYDDQSLLRNSVVYKIGELLGMHTCDFRSVDLYMNGEYQGIYLLCEKVQIQENRVNINDLEEEMEALTQPSQNVTQLITSGALINETIITEYKYVEGINTPADITGGYLVELDNNYGASENSYFKTSNGNLYVIKSPENCSKEQVEYIARVFAEAEEAIYSQTGENSLGKHYTEYTDFDTFIYAYIVAEISQNWDAASSLYFYKDKDTNGVTSKIVKGPLWDCDNTLGNIIKAGSGSGDPEIYWAKNRSFWGALTQHDDFNEAVKEEFKRIYPELVKMTMENGYIDQLVDELGTSIVMEQIRWQSSSDTFWPIYSYYQVDYGVRYEDWSGDFFQYRELYSDGVDDTDATVIGNLKSHLSARTTWLKSVIAPEIPNYTPPAVDTDTDTNTDTSTSTNTDTDTNTNSSTSTDIDTSTNTSTSTNTETNTNTGAPQNKADNWYEQPIILGLLLVVGISFVAIVILAVLLIKKRK